MERFDTERAQIDLTASLSRLRVYLRRIRDAAENSQADENLRTLAKNYRNQAMQFEREATRLFLDIK